MTQVNEELWKRLQSLRNKIKSLEKEIDKAENANVKDKNRDLLEKVAEEEIDIYQISHVLLIILVQIRYLGSTTNELTFDSNSSDSI